MQTAQAEEGEELQEDSDNVITVNGERYLVTKPQPKERTEVMDAAGMTVEVAAEEEEEVEDEVMEPVGEESEPFPKKNDPNPMLPVDPLQYPYLLLPIEKNTAIREFTLTLHPNPNPNPPTRFPSSLFTRSPNAAL